MRIYPIIDLMLLLPKTFAEVSNDELKLLQPLPLRNILNEIFYLKLPFVRNVRQFRRYTDH